MLLIKRKTKEKENKQTRTKIIIIQKYTEQKNESIHSLQITITNINVMNIQSVKCYHFSNHFRKYLHASQGIGVARWHYLAH